MLKLVFYDNLLVLLQVMLQICLVSLAIIIRLVLYVLWVRERYQPNRISDIFSYFLLCMIGSSLFFVFFIFNVIMDVLYIISIVITVTISPSFL